MTPYKEEFELLRHSTDVRFGRLLVCKHTGGRVVTSGGRVDTSGHTFIVSNHVVFYDVVFRSSLGPFLACQKSTLLRRKLSLNCLFAGRNSNNFDLCRPPGN